MTAFQHSVVPPPRTIRFSDLPRQPLDQGTGSAREIWADLDPDLTLRWQLRVIDLKDSTGLLVGPAGTHHHVVGLAGPQVTVRQAHASRALRRDHVLPVLSHRVHFERPRLRPPGHSSVVVLTFPGAADPPDLVLGSLAPGGELDPAARLVLVLRGTVRVGRAEAAHGSALLLQPGRGYRQGAGSARILTVTLPTVHPETGTTRSLDQRDRSG